MARYTSSRLKRSMVFSLLVGCGWLAGLGALAFSQSKEPSPKEVKIDHFKPVVLFQSDIPVEVTEADIRHFRAGTDSELAVVLRNATGGRVNRFVIALCISDGQGHILGGAAIARAWDIKDEEKTDFSMGLKSQIWNEITKATPVFLAIESVESTVGTWKIDPAAFAQIVREISPGDSATPSGPPAVFEPAPRSERVSRSPFRPVNFSGHPLPQTQGGPPPCDASTFLTDCGNTADGYCGHNCVSFFNCKVSRTACACSFTCNTQGQCSH